MYRNSVHSTTNETPAKLILGHSTRTIFDILIIPNTNKVVINNQITQIKNSCERDTVLVKDYRNKKNK